MFPDDDKQKYGLHRHFTVIALVLAGMAVLAGCAQAPARSHSRVPVSVQPLAQLDLPATTDAGRAAALLIAAGFALQDRDAATAAHDYAEAAQLSRDPDVAKRALDLALATRDEAGAARMIERWRALGAGSRQLAGARGKLALLHGDRAGAEAEFGLMLQSADAGEWKTFIAGLLDARDTALAGRVLEDLATPARLPADESIWIALSQLGEHLGRHAFARTLADATVRRFNGAEGIRWAASLRLADHDHAAALALYADGVKAHPNNIDLRLGYAALLAVSNKNREALAVLAAGPQTTATWSARVAYAARAKDATELRNLYASLQRAPAAQRDGNLFLLGQLAELLKHDQQALRWYGEVNPDGEHAFESRVRSAVLLDKAGQHAEAHAVAEQLQQDYVDDPDHLRSAYELDAQMYSQDGEHARAIAAYDRALAAMPDDPVLIYDRGIEQANAGNIDAALAAFRSVLKLKPGNVDAMNALGFTLADANRDLPEAAKLLEKALAAKPGEPAIMDSWGWLQYRLGHLDEAEDYLRRAWDKGSDPDVGVHLGEVLWKLGKQQRARAVLAKVRKLDPKNASLQRVAKEMQP